jgi:hypothetical protein
MMMTVEGAASPTALKIHRFAQVFPALEGSPFAALVTDIKADCLRCPITPYEGKILDGRNRYRTCVGAGVPIKTATYDGSDPLAFVVSANLLRRHLTESQRAMAAAKLASVKHGGDRRPDQAANLPHVSQADAAQKLNVSERSVHSATVLRKKGSPSLVRAVEGGKVAVSVAAKIANLPKPDQQNLD